MLGEVFNVLQSMAFLLTLPLVTLKNYDFTLSGGRDVETPHGVYTFRRGQVRRGVTLREP